MPLNGDTQLVIETMQKLHDQNREDILVLFKKVDGVQDKVGQLPCGEHGIKMETFSTHIKDSGKWRLAIVLLVLGFAGGIFKTVESYGVLKSQVSQLKSDFSEVHSLK